MVRESRHLWVGNLPDSMKNDEIADYFSRFGRVEKVKILPKKSPDGGLAAFVDFVDIRSATKANETTNYIGDRELRTNYNEPGNHPAVLGEGRGRGRPHMYDRGHGGFPRRDRVAPPYNDDAPRRGRYPYGDVRPDYPVKRPRGRRDSEGSHDSDRPPSPKFPRTRSLSASSQSDRGRSSSPEERSYSASDSDARGKSSSPARSNASGKSDKNTSIQIKNLSTRPGDTSIKDALFHEFKKVGEIVNIKILGTEKDRYALLKFRRSEDAEKSLQSNSKIFLGNEMKISIFKGENKDREGEVNFNMYRKKHRSKDFGPDDTGFDVNATRTLFVGNLDKQITHGELRKIFEKYGEVVDVDIKKQNPGITTYAFLQFVDIDGAMRAKQRMDRDFIGRNRIKVGFGRGTPTNVLWLGNVAQNVTEGQFHRHFQQFGYVKRIIIDRQTWQALLSFDSVDAATAAFDVMRNRPVFGRKILIDFASRSCKDGFYERMERTGQLDRRTLEPSPPPARSAVHPSFHNSYGRDRGYRGGYGKGYGYSGRYGPERGEFNNYQQGPPDYYPDPCYGEEEYDDYEKELRDYGHRQRERERERESGRRPERDSSRNRERPDHYRDKVRERKRAYTPLSDDERPHVYDKSDEDDDDDYNEKDIQSKIVLPGSGEKGLIGQESFHEVSPEIKREPDVKGEKKEKKKKKEKKDKSTKRKQMADKDLHGGAFYDVARNEKPVLKESEDTEAGKVKVADEEQVVKLEKKKKRKSSEKGLAAEEKARKKELKKLKKLKKLQSESAGNGSQINEVGSGTVEELSKRADEKMEAPKEKRELLSTDDEKEDRIAKAGKEPMSGEAGPVSPSAAAEEDEVEIPVQTATKTAVESEKEIGEIETSDSELEKLKELASKRAELKRLEEKEKQIDSSKKEDELKGEDAGASDVNGSHGENEAENQNDEDMNSDSDASDLVIDEFQDGFKKDDSSMPADEGIVLQADENAESKEIDSKANTVSFPVQAEKDMKKGIVLDADVVEKVQEEFSKVDSAKLDHEELADEGSKENDRAEEKGSELNVYDKESESEREKVESGDLAGRKEVDASDEESDASKHIETNDIYSSQSDSSCDLEDIDDEEDEDVHSGDKETKKEILAVKSSAERGQISPDRTPPTPDLEEDTLRMQGSYTGYVAFPKQFTEPEKDISPVVESDEEKKELEQSMKEANYQKRMTGEEKKRNRKDKPTGQISPSFEQRPASVDERRGRSPAEKRRKEDVKVKKEVVKEPQNQTRSLESEIRSFRGSPRDSPDRRERKDSKRGESPRKDIPSRRRSSMEASQKLKSPDSRPDSKRDTFARRGSRDRSLSPKRRRSDDNRFGASRGRDRDLKDIKKRDDDIRGIDDGREFRDNRREPIDFRGDREPRDIRENRDARDRAFRDPVRDGREYRDSRDMRDIRPNEKQFRGITEDRINRGFVRDRDLHGDRGRDVLPERGFGRGAHRGHVPFRDGYREQERPGRHSPPLPADQRSRSPLQRYPTSSDRRPRSPEFRHEGRRPRTPEHIRPRSPAQRMSERRRDRSQERRVQSPPRSHEREPEFHRKEAERPSYRDQPDRREREKDRDRREKIKEETPPPPPPPPEPRKEARFTSGPDPVLHQQPPDQQRSTAPHAESPSGTPGSIITPNPPASGGTPTPARFTPPPPPPPTNADTLLDLLRRYPVMWQGLFGLKNDSAAVQMHFLSGNVRLAEASLPRSVVPGDVPPPLRISQRMKLETSQLEGVNKRIKIPNEHCMLLALPCGRDPLDVHAQTRALKTGFITYLQVKQAAGIINIVNSATKQPAYVLHIFPPCEFAQTHLARVAPDLLDSAADSGHLMVLITLA